MPDFLFYIFAALMLGLAAAVVLLKNPVSSAMALVASFAALAALYISLNAYFIGTLQILVYAGAVMVLFLFIIMLLDIKAEEKRRSSLLATIGAVLLVIGFVVQLGGVLSDFEMGKTPLAKAPLDFKASIEARKAAGIHTPTIDRDLAEGTLPDAKLMGETLFTSYNFHLQVIGVLLLTATVGVIVFSRREDRAPLKRRDSPPA